MCVCVCVRRAVACSCVCDTTRETVVFQCGKAALLLQFICNAHAVAFPKRKVHGAVASQLLFWAANREANAASLHNTAVATPMSPSRLVCACDALYVSVSVSVSVSLSLLSL